MATYSLTTAAGWTQTPTGMSDAGNTVKYVSPTISVSIEGANANKAGNVAYGATNNSNWGPPGGNYPYQGLYVATGNPGANNCTFSYGYHEASISRTPLTGGDSDYCNPSSALSTGGFFFTGGGFQQWYITNTIPSPTRTGAAYHYRSANNASLTSIGSGSERSGNWNYANATKDAVVLLALFTASKNAASPAGTSQRHCYWVHAECDGYGEYGVMTSTTSSGPSSSRNLGWGGLQHHTGVDSGAAAPTAKYTAENATGSVNVNFKMGSATRSQSVANWGNICADWWSYTPLYADWAAEQPALATSAFQRPIHCW